MLALRWFATTTLLVACAGSTRYRTELVGHGNGMVASRVGAAHSDVVAAPGAGGIQLPQGNYELAMRFDIPRAQVIDWKIVCPGVDVAGQVGETFEQYRERRIAELRRDRDNERARVASATSFVVGAITPRVEARGRAGNVHVHGEAGLDGDAVGAAVANGAVADVIELAPGDVGRGSLAASARVMTGGDGVCALHVSADDADVRAVFTVSRIRDLAAEERMRTIAAREVAVRARGQLTAQLVTAGADPAVRQARLDAEAARAAAAATAQFEARARAEARVRASADLRARHEAVAIYTRQEYLAFLAGKCGAEPGRRDRIAEQDRRRREARLVAYAEVAQRRDQAALRARATIRAQLIALGAKERPPMPAPRPEAPGTAPFDGAEWTPGYWSWASGDWAWQDGGWTDPDLFGDAGDALVEVGVGVGVTGARTYQTGTRDHRRGREHRRDHRDDSPPTWNHSHSSKREESRDSGRTRDHRDESRPSWTPKDHDRNARVRDHRSDDDDDKDDKPRIRDHR